VLERCDERLHEEVLQQWWPQRAHVGQLVVLFDDLEDGDVVEHDGAVQLAHLVEEVRAVPLARRVHRELRHEPPLLLQEGRVHDGDFRPEFGGEARGFVLEKALEPLVVDERPPTLLLLLEELAELHLGRQPTAVAVSRCSSCPFFRPSEPPSARKLSLDHHRISASPFLHPVRFWLPIIIIVIIIINPRWGGGVRCFVGQG